MLKKYRPMSKYQPKTGIILSGGGARAAYQIGVLKAVYEQIPEDSHNPFPVICGASAGAINATLLASYAGQYRKGLRRMESVWSSFHLHHIFTSDYRGMLKQVLKFARQLLTGTTGSNRISMLDNGPLRELLRQVVPFHRIQELIAEEVLHAVCVTCSAYHDGSSYSFYQGHHSIQDWQRHRRLGLRDNIHLNHLMASSAIPILFPAVEINHQYFGDGSVGFLSPISPALHLGADKVMIIGLDPSPEEPTYICFDKTKNPGIADIAGHVLDSVFIDSLDSDLETLRRINRTLDKIPEHLLSQVPLELKDIETLLIAPSKELGSLAAECVDELPSSAAFFFKRLGISGDTGSNILSYLLFEQVYCKKLIALGYQDAQEKESELRYFFRHLGTTQ